MQTHGPWEEPGDSNPDTCYEPNVCQLQSGEGLGLQSWGPRAGVGLFCGGAPTSQALVVRTPREAPLVLMGP